MLFQMGLSFLAIFSYRIQLPGRTVHCLTLQAYMMGSFAAGFLDDEDLAEINKKIMAGRLVRGTGRYLLLVYNVIAEGMTREIFYDTLDFSRRA